MWVRCSLGWVRDRDLMIMWLCSSECSDRVVFSLVRVSSGVFLVLWLVMFRFFMMIVRC